MVEVKQVSGSAASKKKKTTRKKTAAPRKAASKVANKNAATAKKPAARKARRKAPTPEQRYRLIAEAAFLKAERRGFEGGDTLQDWLEAEQEVESSLTD